jgi:multiple sugar transport system permease protein
VMRPQLLFGAVMAIVNSFAVFQVAVQVAGLPSPLYAGHTIVAHLYDFAFIRFEMGYASAIAVVLFAFTFVLSRWVMRVLSERS